MKCRNFLTVMQDFCYEMSGFKTQIIRFLNMTISAIFNSDLTKVSWQRQCVTPGVCIVWGKNLSKKWNDHLGLSCIQVSIINKYWWELCYSFHKTLLRDLQRLMFSFVDNDPTNRIFPSDNIQYKAEQTLLV